LVPQGNESVNRQGQAFPVFSHRSFDFQDHFKIFQILSQGLFRCIEISHHRRSLITNAPALEGQALGRLAESQLYDVKPTDPVTMAGAVCILAAGVVGAVLMPARRASAVNPTDALRFE
jgi:hypothetical protein